MMGGQRGEVVALPHTGDNSHSKVQTRLLTEEKSPNWLCLLGKVSTQALIFIPPTALLLCLMSLPPICSNKSGPNVTF